MNKDDEYRENAAECERMARITRDTADKRTRWRLRAMRSAAIGMHTFLPTSRVRRKNEYRNRWRLVFSRGSFGFSGTRFDYCPRPILNGFGSIIHGKT
jgi:hypothetical protein